jgi:hypothetical protein
MAGGILILLLTTTAAMLLVNAVARPGSVDHRLLRQLYFYHVALSIVYYLYVLYNPSDSRGYYYGTFSTDDWWSLYGTSTTFIRFLAYPFVRYLAFSYEASMALFAFFGYLGFVAFYLAFREQIRFRHTFLGVDLFKLIFFLPNLHFWSGSLGKGSVIFLGIALFFYGVSHLRSRLLWALLGGALIYHVRPHIMLVMLVSFALAFVFSTKGVTFFWRAVFLAGATTAFFFIYQDVLTLIGIDEEQFVTQGLDLTHRATELSKATSGVDIANYTLPMQVFTFLFRPLFFDAPGLLGWVVSVENVFYLLITMRLLSRLSGWRHLAFGGFLSKGAFFSFLSVSIALAQISGNLGLAIRQKSQVMILFLFVVLAYLDEERKRSRIQRGKKRVRLPAAVQENSWAGNDPSGITGKRLKGTR